MLRELVKRETCILYSQDILFYFPPPKNTCCGFTPELPGGNSGVNPQHVFLGGNKKEISLRLLLVTTFLTRSLTLEKYKKCTSVFHWFIE